MPIIVNMTPVGVVLASAFALLVSGILWWMLNPPTIVKMVVPVAVEEMAGEGAILVPVTGSQFSEMVVGLAAGLAQREQVPISFLYVLEVPMALPPDADIPRDREKGEEVLIHVQGLAQKLGIPTTARLMKARAAGAAIVQAARESRSRMIVLPSGERQRVEGYFGHTVDYVFRYAPCDVMIYRPTVFCRL
ncbi:MAG: universal stress protein [Chloroflexota bacterium]